MEFDPTKIPNILKARYKAFQAKKNLSDQKNKASNKMLSYLPVNMYSEKTYKEARSKIKSYIEAGDYQGAKDYVTDQLKKYDYQTKSGYGATKIRGGIKYSN